MDRNGMSWMVPDNGAPFLSVLLGSYPFMLEPFFFVGIPWRWCSAAMLLGITTETCGSCLNG